MRVYIDDNNIDDNNINIKINTLLLDKPYTLTSMTKIYSIEGIFHVDDNILSRVTISDVPVERKTIQGVDLIVDKSTYAYDTDWLQLHPNHICENISLYTYSLTDDLQLVIERNSKDCIKYKEIYFLTNALQFEKVIGTFLSDLNLC